MSRRVPFVVSSVFVLPVVCIIDEFRIAKNLQNTESMKWEIVIWILVFRF